MDSCKNENMQSNELITLQKLPKPLLCIIISYLNAKSIAAVLRLNKFFLQLVSNSVYSNIIWKKLVSMEDNLLDKKAEDIMKYVDLSEYEKQLDKYLLLFKYGAPLEWDDEYKPPGHVIFNNGKTLKRKEGGWGVLFSKRVLKGGFHLVEISIDNCCDELFLFLGICIMKVKIREYCITSYSTTTWAAGYDVRGSNMIVESIKKNWSKGDIIGIVLDIEQQLIGYHHNGTFLGWHFKNFLGNKKIPLNIMACTALPSQISLTTHILGKKSVTLYMISKWNKTPDFD